MENENHSKNKKENNMAYQVIKRDGKVADFDIAKTGNNLHGHQ